MKNFYATLLAGSAMLMAGSSQAQVAVHSKTGVQLSRTSVVNPHPVAHNQNTSNWRGGPPPNDNCGAVTIDALASGATLNYTGTTVGATADGDAVAGSGLDLGGDTVFVFHAFTTTGCNDISIAYCGTDPQPAIYQAVLSTTCPMDADLVNFSSGEFTSCSDGNATINWVAVPAGTYYVPVRGEPATAGAYTLAITATACPTAPANDECAGAISLTSSADCNAVPFLTTGATSSLDAIECDGFTSPVSNDVWFSFVATSVDQTIAVQGFNESDPFVELFEGPCANLNSLACQDTTFPMSAGENTSEQLIYSGLTIGTTYFVRVYDYGHASPDHSFEICVTEGLGNNIGIEEASNDKWSLFPNPGTGVFNLQYIGGSGRGTIEVFDVAGRIVYSQVAQLHNGVIRTIDLTGVTTGNYSVRLTMNGTRTEQRLMVK